MTARRPTSWIPVFCVLLMTASSAWAQQRNELDRVLQRMTAPEPGFERARVRGMPWCSNVHEPDRDWAGTVRLNLDSYRRDTHVKNNLFSSARALCSAGSDPLAQRAWIELEQLWINQTGMAEADAFVSFSLRADDAVFQADRTQLCDAIKPRRDDPEEERKALATARNELFGCRADDPLWWQSYDVWGLESFVDRGAIERDELAHVAWVLLRQWKELNPDEPDAILGYAIDQFDFTRWPPTR
jgi:hypothetical protein